MTTGARPIDLADTTTYSDPPAATADTRPGPITAAECAAMAAAVLRRAEEIVTNTELSDAANRAASLTMVAERWKDLGVAIAQHIDLTPPDARDNR